MELYNPLCNFVDRMVNDEELSKDIVQEVFIHFWENRKGIKIKSNVSAYFFQACKHKTIEKIRKNSTEKRHLAEKLKIDVSTKTDFDAESERFLKMERINNSVRQLPPKCREVFLLHRRNGLTYREIGDHLNISPKTVENHMIKALKILRNVLKNQS